MPIKEIFLYTSDDVQYTSDDVHKFYTDDTNTFTIDGSGNVSSSGYIYMLVELHQDYE